MKTKVTLIFTEYDRTLTMTDLNHIQIYLNDDLEFPSCYLGVKEPVEALAQIYSENFMVDESWFAPILSDFRKTTTMEYEVVYNSSRPIIPNMNKTGKFYTMYEIKTQQIEIDPYYEQLLRTNNFLIV
tara:strand:+ start:310 stop:693 length:384 start_codon:yes stop_codon:yes gene_type:complete